MRIMKTLQAYMVFSQRQETDSDKIVFTQKTIMLEVKKEAR